MKAAYRRQMKDFENRLQNIRQLFEDPVQTIREGRAVVDDDATMNRALSLLLGARPDDPRLGMRGSPNQISARQEASAKRSHKKMSSGVLQ